MAAGRSHRVISRCCKGMADMEIPSSFEGFVYLGQVDSTCAHDNDGTLARLFCHTLTMESCCCQLTLEASSLFHRVVLPTTAPWPGWKVVLFAGSCERKSPANRFVSESTGASFQSYALCQSSCPQFWGVGTPPCPPGHLHFDDSSWHGSLHRFSAQHIPDRDRARRPKLTRPRPSLSASMPHLIDDRIGIWRSSLPIIQNVGSLGGLSLENSVAI